MVFFKTRDTCINAERQEDAPGEKIKRQCGKIVIDWSFVAPRIEKSYKVLPDNVFIKIGKSFFYVNCKIPRCDCDNENCDPYQDIKRTYNPEVFFNEHEYYNDREYKHYRKRSFGHKGESCQ